MVGTYEALLEMGIINFELRIVSAYFIFFGAATSAAKEFIGSARGDFNFLERMF